MDRHPCSIVTPSLDLDISATTSDNNDVTPVPQSFTVSIPNRRAKKAAGLTSPSSTDHTVAAHASSKQVSLSVSAHTSTKPARSSASSALARIISKAQAKSTPLTFRIPSLNKRVLVGEGSATTASSNGEDISTKDDLGRGSGGAQSNLGTARMRNNSKSLPGNLHRLSNGLDNIPETTEENGDDVETCRESLSPGQPLSVGRRYSSLLNDNQQQNDSRPLSGEGYDVQQSDCVVDTVDQNVSGCGKEQSVALECLDIVIRTPKLSHGVSASQNSKDVEVSGGNSSLGSTPTNRVEYNNNNSSNNNNNNNNKSRSSNNSNRINNETNSTKSNNNNAVTNCLNCELRSQSDDAVNLAWDFENRNIVNRCLTNYDNAQNRYTHNGTKSRGQNVHTTLVIDSSTPNTCLWNTPTSTQRRKSMDNANTNRTATNDAESTAVPRQRRRGDWIVRRDYRTTDLTNTGYGGKYNLWTQEDQFSPRATSVQGGEETATVSTELSATSRTPGFIEELGSKSKEMGSKFKEIRLDGEVSSSQDSCRTGDLPLLSSEESCINRELHCNSRDNCKGGELVSTPRGNSYGEKTASSSESQHIQHKTTHMTEKFGPSPRKTPAFGPCSIAEQLLKALSTEDATSRNLSSGMKLVTPATQDRRTRTSNSIIDPVAFSVDALLVDRSLNKFRQLFTGGNSANLTGSTFLGNRLITREVHLNRPISREVMYRKSLVKMKGWARDQDTGITDLSTPRNSCVESPLDSHRQTLGQFTGKKKKQLRTEKHLQGLHEISQPKCDLSLAPVSWKKLAILPNYSNTSSYHPHVQLPRCLPFPRRVIHHTIPQSSPSSSSTTKTSSSPASSTPSTSSSPTPQHPAPTLSSMVSMSEADVARLVRSLETVKLASTINESDAGTDQNLKKDASTTTTETTQTTSSVDASTAIADSNNSNADGQPEFNAQQVAHAQETLDYFWSYQGMGRQILGMRTYSSSSFQELLVGNGNAQLPDFETLMKIRQGEQPSNKDVFPKFDLLPPICISNYVEENKTKNLRLVESLNFGLLSKKKRNKRKHKKDGRHGEDCRAEEKWTDGLKKEEHEKQFFEKEENGHSNKREKRRAKEKQSKNQKQEDGERDGNRYSNFEFITKKYNSGIGEISQTCETNEVVESGSTRRQIVVKLPHEQTGEIEDDG